MCGIAGIISDDLTLISKEIIEKMTEALVHRGPDGNDVWMNPKNNAGFGHRRLSIIDLNVTGKQPMHYLSRYTIVYNGEIYNYIELKQDLKKQGYRFKSSSDTEVILAMYDLHKEKCTNFFDGMFAFAIWDEREQILFAARDRFGEKPFFYSYNEMNHTLIFSSEMKALWAMGLPKVADGSMLLNYITLGFTQHPQNSYATFFEVIKKLPAAHYLKYNFRTKELTTKLYWKINLNREANVSSFDNCVQQFSELFNTSVKRRLRSDVPIGTSLSGGLDSSSIVATILKNFRSDLPVSGTENLKTFSAVFKGFKKDESRHIDLLAERYKIESIRVTPTVDDLIIDFAKINYYQEEPFQSSGCLAQFKVFELAKEHGVKVLLDGQGADETLAGYSKYYHWFWQELLLSKGVKFSKNERDKMSDPSSDVEWNYKNYIAAYFPKLTAQLLTKRVERIQKNHPEIRNEFLRENFDASFFFKPVVKKLNDILYFNTFQFGLEELLRYADRNAMAHGVEVRLPFLNHQLVEFIFSLPSQYKIQNGFTKFLLRTSMNHILPEEIGWRKDKIGFETPQKLWMGNTVLQDYIHEAKKKLVAKNILKSTALDKEVKPLDSYDADNFDWRYLTAASIV
ncbi:MAG TPA: asparagine synthase (glutamine-hydrolyzing) [Hanamia sp.]|nr:asparagine synthase (glutamine-hydrolyzing) [Hanamia sp.]